MQLEEVLTDDSVFEKGGPLHEGVRDVLDSGSGLGTSFGVLGSLLIVHDVLAELLEHGGDRVRLEVFHADVLALFIPVASFLDFNGLRLGLLESVKLVAYIINLKVQRGFPVSQEVIETQVVVQRFVLISLGDSYVLNRAILLCTLLFKLIDRKILVDEEPSVSTGGKSDPYSGRVN